MRGTFCATASPSVIASVVSEANKIIVATAPEFRGRSARDREPRSPFPTGRPLCVENLARRQRGPGEATDSIHSTPQLCGTSRRRRRAASRSIYTLSACANVQGLLRFLTESEHSRSKDHVFQ
jgi:hypothetical protein